MTEPIIYKDDGEMLVGSKTLKCSYCADAYVDLKNAPPGYSCEYKEPDYSKMYFIFQFKDGKTAKYRMDKDCHTLQQFLDRMNAFHELEKENKKLNRQLKRLKSQLKDANMIIKGAERFDPFARWSPATAYIKRWGVK